MAILRIYYHGCQGTCSPNVLIIFSLIHLLPIQVTVVFCVALLGMEEGKNSEVRLSPYNRFC